MFELFHRAKSFGNKTAVIDQYGPYSYQELDHRSDQIASWLVASTNDLCEKCVAYMIPPGYQYVVVQWAIWKAGGIAVPICTDHPAEAIAHVLENSEAEIVITTEQYLSLLGNLRSRLPVKLLTIDDIQSQDVNDLPGTDLPRKAMLLYTSGTTSKPKGAVITFGNIEAQVTSLVTCWKWSPDDHILSVLPLHHVHGIINVVTCALWSGATVEFLAKFDPAKVFEAFLKKEINLFMAVPTIYYQLIDHFNQLTRSDQEMIRDVMRNFRLMVSGSAALPIPVLSDWQKISGQILLERYGMTEIGMALSNPLEGERKPGYVGKEVPGVKVRLVNEKGRAASNKEIGEIQVRSRNVFSGYWKNQAATEEAFEDGWFRTGDIAICENGYYKILGRQSVDIIKSGGYKISALEIEDILLSHREIKECAVVGLPDGQWGEVVGVVYVGTSANVDKDLIKNYLLDKLPKYKVPRVWRQVESLPRNALGKVTKNVLKDHLIKI